MPDKLLAFRAGRKCPLSLAGQVASMFLIISVLWIVLSDRIVHFFFGAYDSESVVQTVKGLAYVAAIAYLIYYFTRRGIKQLEQAFHREARANLDLVQGLAQAVELRDKSSGEHSFRMQSLVHLLARTSGQSEEQADLLKQASVLHDIGKIGIPDSILLKAGPLDADEWVLMKEHVPIGARFLQNSDLPVLQLAYEIVLTHHENWDGSGYPKGLSGEEIPRSGQIVAIVDTFDALMSDRPYKQAWSFEASVEEIRSLAGIRFDPRLVNLFLDRLSDIRAIYEDMACKTDSSRVRVKV